MIKINRLPCPEQLTQEVKDAKTAKYRESAISVWNESYIKDRLLEMSHNKCCYCECNVNAGGSYMEVEHFHPKGLYPDEVVDWNNLLPSCKKCNAQKGEHDTVTEPIINPVVDRPQNHLKIRMGVRFMYKDDIGLDTITVLDLNNQVKHVTPRHKIVQKIDNKIDGLFDQTNEYIDSQNKTTRRKNKLLNGVRDLLQVCQPTEPYSAFMASALLSNEHYNIMKDRLIDEGLWPQEFIDLESELLSIKYETC